MGSLLGAPRFDQSRLRTPAAVSRATWLGVVAIILAFALSTLRSFLGIVTSPTAVVSIAAVRLCTTEGVGTRLGADLARSFFLKNNARDIQYTSIDNGLSVSATFPGSFSRTSVDVTSGDSATAFRSLAGNRCNVAVTGRPYSPFEAQRFSVAPAASLVALDGAVLVVNPANHVRSLSVDDVRKIFSGEHRSWAELGGENRQIRVILPPARSDAEEITVTRLLGGHGARVASIRSEDVASIVSAPSEIGAIGLTTFHASDPARILREVSSNGKVFAPSTLDISRKTYPLTLPVYVYREENNVTPEAYRFISYLNSDEGRTVLVGDGFVSPYSL